jgi:hypothetical protein
MKEADLLQCRVARGVKTSIDGAGPYEQSVRHAPRGIGPGRTGWRSRPPRRVATIARPARVHRTSRRRQAGGGRGPKPTSPLARGQRRKDHESPAQQDHDKGGGARRTRAGRCAQLPGRCGSRRVRCAGRRCQSALQMSLQGPLEVVRRGHAVSAIPNPGRPAAASPAALPRLERLDGVAEVVPSEIHSTSTAFREGGNGRSNRAFT